MLISAFWIGNSRPAQAQSARDDFYVTDGGVAAAVVAGNSLYLAGDFTHVGPASGGGVPFDATSALPVPGFPKVAGFVQAVEPDGSGGWYIGGGFTAVGGVRRHNLAHILSDNSVSSWNPNPDGVVYALAKNGNTIYAGGDFDSIGTVERVGIAALDAASGVPTAWTPSPRGGSRIVFGLEVSGSTIYVCGEFDRIGGARRPGIAGLDIQTGLATPFNPELAVLGVYSIAVSADGTTIYAGGSFGNIGGQPRAGLAALDAATGLATAWNPNVSPSGPGSTYALESTGPTVFAWGDQGLAALDSATGVVNASNTGLSLPLGLATFSSLAPSGTTLYAGGPLGVVGLDATSLLPTGWDPQVRGGVSAIAVSGGTVYVGGYFTIVGGVVRNHFAALDVITGLPTPWDPNAVLIDHPELANYSLVVTGSTVYAAGPFSQIGGQARNGVAALDATTGAANSWNPIPEIPESACYEFGMAVHGGTVYIGGPFTRIGGAARNGIAALDAATGLATPWDPNPSPSPTDVLCSGVPYRFALSGTTAYVAGPFFSIGGQPRTLLAALDLTTGLATSWDPNSNPSLALRISALAVSGGTVYAGGNFTEIGGQPRNNLAALDTRTGLATAWNPNPIVDYDPDPRRASVSAIAVRGSTAYVSGSFDVIGGQTRHGISALDAKTGLATAWNVNPGPTRPNVVTLALGGRSLFAGGFFYSMGNLPQSHIAAIEAVDSGPDWSDAATGISVDHRQAEKSPASCGSGAGKAYASAALPPEVSRQLALAVLDRSGEATIRYALDATGPVRISVFDLAGRRVAALDEGVRDAGVHQRSWDSGALSGGVYFYRLEVNDGRVTKAALHLR